MLDLTGTCLQDDLLETRPVQLFSIAWIRTRVSEQTASDAEYCAKT
jgi:hypothetical protein